MSGAELQILRPDGKPFLSYAEIAQRAAQMEQRLKQTEQQLEPERSQAPAERLRFRRSQSRSGVPGTF